jgi:ParB family chromosome partitioning protein
VSEIISIEESKRLISLEAVITKGLNNFIEVGEALLEIRDSRLYRIEHGTFETYCREKWGMSKQRANQLVSAASVVDTISKTTTTVVAPSSERQARPLTSLEPEIQREAWKEVVHQSQETGKPITAATVQQVAEQWKPINQDVRQAKETPMFAPPIEQIIEERRPKAHVSYNTGENEWYTPACYIESSRRVMGSIDLDPASSLIANERVGATKIYTQENDGLQYEWSGNVWMNPPYAQPLIMHFVSKLAESEKVNQAIVLVNNGTETAWGQTLLKACSSVCFPQGRIKFIDPEGNPGQSPLQGQMIAYIGSNTDAFRTEFAQYGTVL